MTCIVGIEALGGVIMGADSGSFGAHGGITIELSQEDSKIFHCGDFLVGVAGSPRLSNVLRYCVPWPNVPKSILSDRDLFQWLVRTLVPIVRRTCENEKLELQRSSSDDHEDDTGDILFGVAGRLYTLESDFHIERSASGYNAIGIAGAVAMGALFAFRLKQPLPWEANSHDIINVLNAAAAHSPFVKPPWRTEEQHFMSTAKTNGMKKLVGTVEGRDRVVWTKELKKSRQKNSIAKVI